MINVPSSVFEKPVPSHEKIVMLPKNQKKYNNADFKTTVN